jgi:hypothetical protein
VPKEPAPLEPVGAEAPAREERRAARPSEPHKDKPQRGHRQDRHRRRDQVEDDKPVQGLGDHMPAFLLKAPKPTGSEAA